MAFGTLSVTDLLATQATIAQLGEDVVFQALASDLAAHNAIRRDMLASLADTTTDRLRRYGGSDTMAMEEVDEFGRAQAQKISAGSNVNYPLRLYEISVQWTRKYFQNAAASELASNFQAAQKGDLLMMERQLKRAIFTATNTTLLDRLVDNVSLAVKALLNADSAPIPPNPVDGTAFTASTHTHYLFTAAATLAIADVTALISTVLEHYSNGEVVVYINRAQETAFRALTGFTAYLDARLIPASSTVNARAGLDIQNVYNRAIGIFGGAEIWVKPWVPAGYLFAFIPSAPKPLALRERRAGSSDLTLAVEDEAYPLRARTLESEYGLGVWNRTNGAVLFVDAGSGGVYVSPAIS